MAADQRQMASQGRAAVAGYVLAGGASSRFGFDKALAELGGFDHVEPENVTRVASARGLYNFDALKDQKY